MADNSKMVRAIIKEELEAIGLQVFEAESEENIYSILATIPIHLMTISVELSGHNGYEICHTINGESFYHSPANASDQRFPIIFITSHDTIEGRRHGFESGGADFISKPFSRGEVAASVKNILFPESRLKGCTALVVDDSRQSRMIVNDFLTSMGVVVFEAKTGVEGFELVQQYTNSIDVIITDYEMPGLNGGELTWRVRKELSLKNVPIIVLSGADSLDLLALFRTGVTDYLHKPFIKEELLGRLTVHLEARLLARKLERQLQEMEKLNHHLTKLTVYDLLTGLNNRKFLLDRISEAVDRKDRYDHTLALVILDINHFRELNDLLGHKIGDQILKDIAKILKSCIRRVDVLARSGGEEFAILMSHVKPSGISNLANRIAKKVAGLSYGPPSDHSRLHIAGSVPEGISIAISIGTYLSRPGDGLDGEGLFKEAERSLMLAKERGNGQIEYRESIKIGR